jgi:hypothetical protein
MAEIWFTRHVEFSSHVRVAFSPSKDESTQSGASPQKQLVIVGPVVVVIPGELVESVHVELALKRRKLFLLAEIEWQHIRYQSISVKEFEGSTVGLPTDNVRLIVGSTRGLDHGVQLDWKVGRASHFGGKFRIAPNELQHPLIILVGVIVID